MKESVSFSKTSWGAVLTFALLAGLLFSDREGESLTHFPIESHISDEGFTPVSLEVDASSYSYSLPGPQVRIASASKDKSEDDLESRALVRVEIFPNNDHLTLVRSRCQITPFWKGSGFSSFTPEFDSKCAPPKLRIS
jgi:hypothetical protein